VCDSDVWFVLQEKVTTQQPAGVTGRYAYGHVAVDKEKQFKMVLEHTRSFSQVKTQMSKNQRNNLIILGVLCTKI